MKLPPDLLNEALFISDEITRARRNTPLTWGQSREANSPDRNLGIVAEFAVRWIFKMPSWDRHSYPSFERRSEADIGENVEVRGTAWGTGKLLLHKGHDDIKERIVRDYVLVIIHGDWSYRIAGWIPMKEALELWEVFATVKNSRPCMSVCQNQLWKISELRIMERDRVYRFEIGDKPEQKALFG